MYVFGKYPACVPLSHAITIRFKDSRIAVPEIVDIFLMAAVECLKLLLLLLLHNDVLKICFPHMTKFFDYFTYVG